MKKIIVAVIAIIFVIGYSCRRPTQQAVDVHPPPTLIEFVKRVGPLTKSAPVVISGRTNVVVQNLDITTAGERAIDIRNCTNVIIKNNRVNAATYRSITVEQCTNVIVINNFCDSVGWGIYLNQVAGAVRVDSNWLSQIWGMNPTVTDGNHGEGIMVNNSPNLIAPSVQFNYSYCTPGKGSMQDVINFHNSGGTQTAHARIKNNYIVGGGPSTSSGGILAGDGGESGNYIDAENNVLINPGQYGMAAMGHDNTIANNKIYAKQAAFTNVGITVWQPLANVNCSNNKLISNKVKWFYKSGGENPKWLPPGNDPRGCDGTIEQGNDWSSAEVGEQMPPPAGVPMPGTSQPPTNKPPYVGNGPDYVAKTLDVVKVERTASDEDGTITRSEWSKISGPVGTVKIDSLGLTTANFTFSIAGSYSYRLTVYDNGGASDFEDVLFTISQGALPPTCPPKIKKITVEKTTKIFDERDSLIKSVTTSETISLP